MRVTFFLVVLATGLAAPRLALKAMTCGLGPKLRVRLPLRMSLA